ncbi:MULTISPECIES: hypothetical protein [Microbacterium]|uniref:Uncharacterized protein n=1 Tax=Microbacterium hominis TaxID=162426 RepID=A0A2K9DBG1_9MICO|nr:MULTISPECIES: hypothetical protein [Microbacterium]AUG30940.1 hypothetical protein CXR34_16715 [Microbacterium hominis]QOC26701.1 hypothetical protein IC745_04685 [Microbacterium hominis]QOC27875.1 hypothetical protein IC744_10385 [Microbacterium hominis]QYF96971.1 hypothetical protein KY498_12460 [Microbacterium sp. PAMC21962]
MDQFWIFAQHYWWLVFPVLGVAGGALRRWDVLAQRRHARRLEVMKAKAELKTITASTRVSGSDPQPITKPSPLPDQLEKLFAVHDDVTARWLEYELDVARMIAFPTMSDGRQPLTAAFLRAKKVADRLRPPSADARVGADQVAEYRAAVTDYEVAFDLAEREARRVRDSQFTETERKRLATAQQLLAVALDESATPAERQVAYRRVREEVDGLLALSDEAVEILENRVALQLERPHPASDDERGPANAGPRP